MKGPPEVAKQHRPARNLAVVGPPDFTAWLAHLAARVGTTPARLVEGLLAAEACRLNFDPPPPARR